MSEIEDNKHGRREYDELELVDTTNRLTLEELQELKRLANLSKISRIFVIAILAIVSTLGLSSIVEWFGAHFKW